MQSNGRLVIVPRMREVCKECGCYCTSCLDNNLDLHHEIEELRAKLKRSDNRTLQMEQEYSQSREYAEQEIGKLQDELIRLRDRYDRLFESHKKLQRINHNLEDKLLKIVNKSETEKMGLQQEVANITSRLVDAKVTVCDLEEECEKYREDCNMAVQLLQCKPSNFVAHKLETLPIDLQERVKSRLTREQIMDLENASSQTNEADTTKMIRVPMSTFPPTAMVYSINKVASNPSLASSSGDSSRMDTVPTTLIASVLTQPATKRKLRRLYLCTKCHVDITVSDQEVQTAVTYQSDANGFHHGQTHYRTSPRGASTSFFPSQPGVHRPRLNSTETEI